MPGNYLKKEADELMKIPGNVKGAAILTTATYIKYKKGEEGLKLVEEKMKELGYPLNFDKIEQLEWYPEAISVLVILVAKEIFDWKDSDIFDMGNSAPKYSFIVRILMKTFLSIRRAFEESPKYWKKHYDFGELLAQEINEKEKYSILRLKEYKLHPIICTYFSGYFLRIVQYVTKSQKATAEETKCIHRGDPYHEFLIRWE